MELPHIGKHCSENTCKKLDFLPIKCDACKQIFCEEHYKFAAHNCQNAYQKDNQVPVCPLCNTPIPVKLGQQPDMVVGAHIDNDCKSEPAKNRRQVFINKCSFKGCKTKEVVPVICADCKHNFCLKHRHQVDHKCEGQKGSIKKNAFDALMRRQSNQPPPTNQRNLRSEMQGNMSEDEALARALALSEQETNKTRNLTQEELDLALARQLQESESRGRGSAQTVGGSSSRNSREGCSLS